MYEPPGRVVVEHVLVGPDARTRSSERRSSGVMSMVVPWKYFCVNSGLVIASQIASGVARMKTW